MWIYARAMPPPSTPESVDDDTLRQDAAVQDNIDAFVDGDRTFTPGTARSAFSHRTFRTVYLGAFASNIGTWMQNVVLGALAYELTKSATFVGIMIAAQLGPLLVFSVVGGMLEPGIAGSESLPGLLDHDRAPTLCAEVFLADADSGA